MDWILRYKTVNLCLLPKNSGKNRYSFHSFTLQLSLGPFLSLKIMTQEALAREEQKCLV